MQSTLFLSRRAKNYRREGRAVKSWTLTRQTVPSFSSRISLVVLQIRTISEVHLKRIPSSDFYTHTLVEITARISPRIIRKGVRKIGSQNYFILLQEE